jgi:RHS repeat-associated protein
MMMKNTHYWVRPAMISGIYLLGAMAAHCFWNPEGRRDAVTAAGSPDAKAVSQCRHGPSRDVLRATGLIPKANPFRVSTKCQDGEHELLYYGYRYYNASTGRWLSRDPVDEPGFRLIRGTRGVLRTPVASLLLGASTTRRPLRRTLGGHLYGFVGNDSVDGIDYLGLKCCLITIRRGTYSKYSHSILSCDNGAYISHSVDGDGIDDDRWRKKWMDDRDYPRSERSYTCFDCVDESKITQWFEENQGRVWKVGDNCADVALEAVEYALPAQAKPKCPCVSADLALKGCRSYARDVLQEPPNGTTPGVTLPSDAQRRVDELVANGCNKWKCTVSCIKYPGGRF